MKNVVRYIRVLFVLSFSTGLCAAVKTNQINKIYHHTSHAKGAHIELGSLVFYFEQEPQVKLLASHSMSNGLKEDIFLFPKTKVNSEIIKNLGQVRNGYMVKFEPSIKNQDLKLVIQYDPQKIGTTHDTFDSIGRQKGLAIRFFNKELLDKIRNHPKPILQMAALDKISKKKRLS